MDRFNPSKLVWTDADFEQMSWHDCRLHGVAIIDDFHLHQHELRLDIDYIFEWVGFGNPAEESGFWISPATLVFDHGGFLIENLGSGGPWIIAVERAVDSSKWLISFNTGGRIIIPGGGFRQYIRQLPVFIAVPDQYLESTQRGGISFEISVPQS